MVAILTAIALMVVGIPGTSHGTERDNSSHSLRAVLSDSFSASGHQVTAEKWNMSISSIVESNKTFVLSEYTPWKFNIAPENIPSQKRKVVFQPSFFRGYVKLREGIGWEFLHNWVVASIIPYKTTEQGFDHCSYKKHLASLIMKPQGSGST